MKMSMKKLITIVVAVLITSSAISIFVTFGYTELKESGEKLLVGIKTDRAPVGIKPFSLNLSANVINAKGKIRYRWGLGNGKTAEGKEVMVTYDESGIYNVTLIVYDETGRKTSDYLKVEVKENRPPTVTLIIDKKNVERKRTWLSYFTFSPPLWYAGNQQLQLDRIEKKKGPWAWGESGITITAQINDPEGDEIVSYEWEEQTADELVIWPSGKTILPKHNLTGNETVKIPSLYAWIAGRHIVTLTVKDSVGNEATGTTDYMVSMSQMETRMKTIPTTFTVVTTISETIAKILEICGGTLWNRLPEDQKEQIFYRLDTVYEKINTNPTLKNLPLIQSALSRLLGLIPSIVGVPYEIPCDKANLTTSKIGPLNFSLYINETGAVESNVTFSRSFSITNIETNLSAFDVYVTLDKPYSDEKGLPQELAKEGVVVEVEIGPSTNKLFYHGNFMEWKESPRIDEISPGEMVECTLRFTLRKGVNPERGERQCYLYVYQGKTMHFEKMVDVIPFKVII